MAFLPLFNSWKYGDRKEVWLAAKVEAVIKLWMLPLCVLTNTRAPLLTCLCCLFSAPLSSSSACGSIDKHSWLCNLWNAHLVNHTHTYTTHTHSHCILWTIGVDSTRLDAHLVPFKSLLFQSTVTECKLSTAQYIISENRDASTHFTPHIKSEKYEWSLGRRICL